MAQESTSMLDKAALVLRAFAGDSQVTLSELRERSGLPRSTVHRLVVQLTQYGWIERTGNAYQLGMGLFELGELVPVKHRLRAVSLPFMQDLFAGTGETVHLAVRDGADAVYVEKLHGHRCLPLPSRTGGRAPLTCTAVGKALLAHEPADVVNDVLRGPLRRYTPASIVDPAVLRRQLDHTRRTGVAQEREEAAVGGACVASPVLIGRRVVAALSVSVPVERFAPERLAPAVLTASLALGRALGRREGHAGGRARGVTEQAVRRTHDAP